MANPGKAPEKNGFGIAANVEMQSFGNSRHLP
jgi:hypothetical protein